MATPKQRKMTKISVAETSGVDHPAHLHEGWMIRKDADAATVNKLFGLPDTNTEGASNMADTQEEIDKAANAIELQAKLDKALEEIAELKAKLKGGVTKSADDAGSEADQVEAMAKSAELPEAVREMLAKQASDIRKAEEDMKKAQADFEKERDARLDEQAIAKSADVYKSIAIEHGVVAPALRRVALINEDLAKSVETALKAADEQLKTAGLFTEIGKQASDTESATSRLDAVAKSMVDDGLATNRSDAIAKAVAADPSLYEAYVAEKAGK